MKRYTTVERIAFLPLALSGLLLVGCYAEELADLHAQVERLNACQACAQSQLTQGLALALCSPPVRQLVDDVSHVCRRDDVCLDQKISTLVGDADPTHTGRFISLMRQQAHTVVYFSPRDVLVGGPLGIYAQRLKRLVAPQPAWLPTTRFLVVSNLKVGLGGDSANLSISDPLVKRAESRGQQVIERILDFAFPAAPPSRASAGTELGPSSASEMQKLQRLQVLHWVYGFTRKKDEILQPDDVPIPGSDLGQSVWVFRVDCATPDNFAAEAGGGQNAACLLCPPPPSPSPLIVTPPPTIATPPPTMTLPPSPPPASSAANISPAPPLPKPLSPAPRPAAPLLP